MKKISTIVTVIGILSLLMTISGWAQTGMGPGGGGSGVHYGTMWDGNSVTTLSGEVAAVNNTPPEGAEVHTAFGLP